MPSDLLAYPALYYPLVAGATAALVYSFARSVWRIVPHTDAFGDSRSGPHPLCPGLSSGSSFRQMADRWSTSLAAPRWATVQFVGAWAVLAVLPAVPALVSPLPQSPYLPLAPEILVVVTAVVYGSDTRQEQLVRVVAGATVAGIVLYEVYDAIVYTAFRRTGIVYEDLQLVDNLAYFVYDLLSWQVVGGIVLAAGAVAALGLLVYWAFQVLGRSGHFGGCRAFLVAGHLAAWPLVLVIGPALQVGPVNLTYESPSGQPRIHTTTASAFANVRASFRLSRMLDSLRTTPVDSTYARYDTLTLQRRPSIYLFLVESYGGVLNSHPELRKPYRALLRRTERVLASDGWHMTTARCEIPVRGGRSWLSIASLLTGVRVEHQLLFNQFEARAESSNGEIPHLVRFLDRQGYRTIALQPVTFYRPGLPVRNLYNFDTTVYRRDLNYGGRSYGLADAPDQYSLHFTHQTYLSTSEAPFFLFFETVDSHSLWNYGLPPYLEDWRQFNDTPPVSGSPHPEPESAPPVFLPDSITAPRIFDQPTHLRYLRHVAHELRVLRAYLTEKAPPGSLVLLMGDHQPPLLDTADGTVPLHILSTDSTLVELPRQHGFTAGLHLTDASPRLREEALYSFLVRLLIATDRAAAPPSAHRLPEVQPYGVSPSLLIQ